MSIKISPYEKRQIRFQSLCLISGTIIYYLIPEKTLFHNALVSIVTCVPILHISLVTRGIYRRRHIKETVDTVEE